MHEPSSVSGPMAFSFSIHALIFAAALFPVTFGGRPLNWGEEGRGRAVPVNLTAGIPLPAAPIENPVASDTKTMNPAEIEKPKDIAPQPSAKEYQMEQKKQADRLRQWEREQIERELKARKVASNAIPGRGGRAGSEMYGQFPTTGGSGGIGFGGDFGSRFGWYVRTVRDCISRNWDRSRVEPGVRAAPKTFVGFIIRRDGTIIEEKVTVTSGSASLDRESLRAVQACSGRPGSEARLPALPRDFAEDRIPVEVWFEYK
jgi:protein TonB